MAGLVVIGGLGLLAVFNIGRSLSKKGTMSGLNTFTPVATADPMLVQKGSAAGWGVVLLICLGVFGAVFFNRSTIFKEFAGSIVAQEVEREQLRANVAEEKAAEAHKEAIAAETAKSDALLKLKEANAKITKIEAGIDDLVATKVVDAKKKYDAAKLVSDKAVEESKTLKKAAEEETLKAEKAAKKAEEAVADAKKLAEETKKLLEGPAGKKALTDKEAREKAKKAVEELLEAAKLLKLPVDDGSKTGVMGVTLTEEKGVKFPCKWEEVVTPRLRSEEKLKKISAVTLLSTTKGETFSGAIVHYTSEYKGKEMPGHVILRKEFQLDAKNTARLAADIAEALRLLAVTRTTLAPPPPPAVELPPAAEKELPKLFDF